MQEKDLINLNTKFQDTINSFTSQSTEQVVRSVAEYDPYRDQLESFIMVMLNYCQAYADQEDNIHNLLLCKKEDILKEIETMRYYLNNKEGIDQKYKKEQLILLELKEKALNTII